jgi:prepilin-type N-terminal cleavage/methylation domain-containing protein
MRMNKKMKEAGFSLVELMVVVAIIGVLAALAVPRFQTFQAKAKQSEVKNNLSHIYTLEQSWYGDHDVFLASAASHDLTNVGFKAQGKTRYFYDALINASAQKFRGVGLEKTNGTVSAGSANPDQWVIDDGKDMCAMNDVVTGTQSNWTVAGGACSNAAPP